MRPQGVALPRSRRGPSSTSRTAADAPRWAAMPGGDCEANSSFWNSMASMMTAMPLPPMPLPGAPPCRTGPPLRARLSIYVTSDVLRTLILRPVSALPVSLNCTPAFFNSFFSASALAASCGMGTSMPNTWPSFRVSGFHSWPAMASRPDDSVCMDA